MLSPQTEPLNRETILKALSQIERPGSKDDVVSQKLIEQIEISGDKVKVLYRSTPLSAPEKKYLIESSKNAIRQLSGVDFVHVAISNKPIPSASSPSAKRLSLPGVQHVIAVASGKGGVGKSTVTINLAAALQAQNFRVGILDADIYGPSLPTLLGIQTQPIQSEGKIAPIIQYDLTVMSMGFLVPENQPVVWRGPMVHSALTQFMTQVAWGELDYLLIDMPPGTGDAQLTISQLAPLTGAIIVTTPQEMSLVDARKGMKMFLNVQVPILGIVENMSGFISPENGKVYEIFKGQGGSQLAEESGSTLLGSIPLDPQIAEAGDAGCPLPLRYPDSQASLLYKEITQSLTKQIKSSEKFKSMGIDWN